MKRTSNTALTALVIALLFCVGAAFGQRPAGPDETMGPGRGHKEEMKELLSTVYLMELTKELGLSKEQALEVSMIVDKEEKAKKELQKSLREAVREIKHELGKNKPSEKKLSKYIADATAARDKMKANASATRDKILSKLSVTQQAKFVIFHGKWMKKMNRIKEHIKNERMRKRHGGMGGPGPGSKGPHHGKGK